MISDDDLILYYYRDGLDAAERARIGAALAEQPELAQRLHKLVGRLDAAAAIPEVPVPEPFRQRWRAALDQAAQEKPSRLAPPKRAHFTPWLAAAAVAAVAIVVVFQLRQPPPAAQTAQVTTPAAGAYERGLQSHLASTEQQLASLESATPEERARLVESIIEQNRIYALAAERAGEPQLARVLRAFSPVLEGLQKGGDTSASVAQLAFELRVMQGRLAAAPASHNRSTTL
jgi:anti-sigma factor RsiW